MYCIGFNGPPRSGKDTLATILAGHLDTKTDLPVHYMSLSQPMRDMAYGALNDEYTLTGYERIKDEMIPELGAITLRQLMIQLNERFMKPRFGPDVWARLLLKDWDFNTPSILIVPDFGFQVEADFFTLAFNPNPDPSVLKRNFYLNRVHRLEHDFSNDSRSYIDSPGAADIRNDGDLDDLHTEAIRIYRRLVNQLGWKL